MISRIHRKLGTAGFIISIVALVVALGGGAYAASGGLNGKQKKEVEKIAKKYAGKNGATGATGPTGSAGANGKDGTNGTNGTNGTDGTSGGNGKSVVVTAATAAECSASNPKTGATVEVAGEPTTKQKICAGKEGSPWVAGGTLPEKQTETGVWGTGLGSPAGKHSFPISFTLPLSTAPEPVLVNANEESKTGKCPGRGGGTYTEGYKPTIPEAEPGKLCVYVMDTEGAGFTAFRTPVYEEGFGEFELAEGASQTGTLVEYNCTALCNVSGTWAVTGPEE